MLFKKYFFKSTLETVLKDIQVGISSNILDTYKVLQISDLHIDTHTSIQEIESLVNKLNSIKCNILVITGDILDCNVKKIEKKLYLFKNLKHESYYVSGNHDLVHGYQKLNEIMKKCEIKLLDNTFEIVRYKDKEIVLAGLSDKFSRFFNIKRHEKELVEKLNRLHLPIIFLAHQPKDYKFAIESNSELFLCGHTHGGQIYPFNYLVRIVQPFISGLYNVKNMPIYVNNGIGAWGIKYRFGIKSEITLINLEIQGPCVSKF